MRTSRSILLTFGAILALAAAEPRAEESGGEQQELNAVEQELQSSKATQEALAASIAQALKEQEEVSARLVDISRRIQAQEAAINVGAEDVLKLNKEEILVLSELAERQDVLSELLAGLQRLEQNPPPALVVEPDNVLEALRGAMLFGSVVPELKAEADKLADSLARLDEIRAGIKARKDSIAANLARLATAQNELKGLIEAKRQLAAEGSARLAAERQKSSELAAKAKSLKQLIETLAAERQRAAEEADRQAKAEERERRRLEALAQTPRIAFAEARGRLAYPAQGQILKQFGDDDGLGSSVKGVVIATREQAQVTTPADGRVEFAGPFRSYGKVLILDAGGGYHLLLAGLAEISADTGEFLRAGEPVGTMGNGPSSVTLLGDLVQDTRPVLYIEFRNKGEAVDSAPWWIGGRQEAHG